MKTRHPLFPIPICLFPGTLPTKQQTHPRFPQILHMVVYKTNTNMLYRGRQEGGRPQGKPRGSHRAGLSLMCPHTQRCVSLPTTAPKAPTARQRLLFLICKGRACDCTPLHAAQHFCIMSSADFTQRLE